MESEAVSARESPREKEIERWRERERQRQYERGGARVNVSEKDATISKGKK